MTIGFWAARDKGQDHAGDLHDVQQQETGGGDQAQILAVKFLFKTLANTRQFVNTLSL
jgi:hypothetical protein